MRVLNFAAVVLVGCLFMYGLFSFYAVSFDIRMWSEAARFMCAFMQGMVAFAALLWATLPRY